MSVYDNYKATIDGGQTSGGTPIDYLSDTIDLALATTTYTPSLTLHDFFDDVTNELAAGSGYTAGGTALASKVTVLNSPGVMGRDAADVTFTFSASKTFRYGIIYKSTGTASTSPLMFLIDFDGTTNITALTGTFTVVFNASGIFTIS